MVMHQTSQPSLLLNKLQCNLWILKPCFIVFVPMLFSMWYCQSPYENDELDTGKRIPVVVGYLDNSDGPHEVSIHYAKPYNTTKYEAVQGAKVYITDGLGNLYQLYEEKDAEGKYISVIGELTGAIGETYQLNIVMPDGKHIISEPAIIPPAVEVDTLLYQGWISWTEMDNDVDGIPLVTTKRGSGVFAVIKNISQDVAYYRVSCNPVTENTTITLDTLFWEFDEIFGAPIQFALWDLHHWYKVNKPVDPLHIGRLSASANYTREELSIFVFRTQQKLPESLRLEGMFGRLYSVAWIFPFRIHAITPGIYQFYENQLAQLNAPDRIYDPIPSQLAGNLFMKGDEHQPVLGMFEASSMGKMNIIVEAIVYPRVAYPAITSRMLPDTITLPRKIGYKRGGQLRKIFFDD